MTLRNDNRDFAKIVKQGEKEFVVIFGYTTPSFEAYGNDTATQRKFFKSEKTAMKKAKEYLNID
jgi:hypothetical protein